jgi:hypothetical protein
VPRSSAERANPFENAAAAAAAGERRYIRTGLDDAAAALAATSRLRASVSRIKASAMAPGRGGADGGVASFFLPRRLAAGLRRLSTAEADSDPAPPPPPAQTAEGSEGGPGPAGSLRRLVSRSDLGSSRLLGAAPASPPGPPSSRRLSRAFSMPPGRNVSRLADNGEADRAACGARPSGAGGAVGSLHASDRRAAAAAEAATADSTAAKEAGAAEAEASATIVFRSRADRAPIPAHAAAASASSGAGAAEVRALRPPVRASLALPPPPPPASAWPVVSRPDPQAAASEAASEAAAPAAAAASAARSAWTAHAHQHHQSSPPPLSRGHVSARSPSADAAPSACGGDRGRQQAVHRPEWPHARRAHGVLVMEGGGGGGGGGGGIKAREPTPDAAYRPERTPR